MKQSATILMSAVAALCVSAPAPAHAATASAVYTFAAGLDPRSSLTRMGSRLYGVTRVGGAAASGTVYALTPDGHFTLVASLPGGRFAALPTGRLLAAKGVLYGTAAGTIFTVTPGGTFTTLFTFQDAKTGSNVQAGLTALGTIFYGTALDGGQSNAFCKQGCGTAFSITQAGLFTVLHTFTGTGDGDHPSELVAGAGKLFGTTSSGAEGDFGTIFSLTPAGVLTTLHVFAGGANGDRPVGRLLYDNGALYGAAGGGDTTGNCKFYGCGIVYRLSLTGEFTVLHTFDGTDGTFPTGGLIDVKGTLFGTTEYGGAGKGGVVYSIDASGAFSVVYGFAAHQESWFLTERLIDVNGSFYGTSLKSGDRSQACLTYGCGTVFKVTP